MSRAQADDSHLPSAAVLVPAMVKVADYDRHFLARANGLVRTLVIFHEGDLASEKSAIEIVSVLAKTGKIAGLAHEERAEPYPGANALASQIRSEQSAILVLATGFGNDAPAIAHELDGIDVLSVAVDADDVPKGIVFGVDARAGKSTLVIRLAQARRQNVAFEASLLKLARIE
ncbi:MAG: YfiR/HmsC family protein [Polyangiaceae bacterium]